MFENDMMMVEGNGKTVMNNKAELVQSTEFMGNLIPRDIRARLCRKNPVLPFLVEAAHATAHPWATQLISCCAAVNYRPNARCIHVAYSYNTYYTPSACKYNIQNIHTPGLKSRLRLRDVEDTIIFL